MPQRMQVEPIVVSDYQENTFLVWDDETMRGAVVDPGAEGKRLLNRIERIGFVPEAILLTHGHSDHIGAVGDIKAAFDIPIYIGAGEEELLTDPTKNLSAAFGLNITSPPADHLLRDGDTIEVAGFEFHILLTPGHSPASICYLHEKTMFCGDVVFMGSIGRTDLPGCNHNLLMKSLSEKVLPLDDAIYLYPGHGPATTVGRERTTNPFLLQLQAVEN
jgi:hydroxyacylglutathione hydrolase